MNKLVLCTFLLAGLTKGKKKGKSKLLTSQPYSDFEILIKIKVALLELISPCLFILPRVGFKVCK